jgi:hypothetical protein
MMQDAHERREQKTAAPPPEDSRPSDCFAQRLRVKEATDPFGDLSQINVAPHVGYLGADLSDVCESTLE